MDNAGKKIAQFITEKIDNPFNQTFIIIVGPGNNGSDGIICHFYLLKYGITSKLLLCENKIKENKILNIYKIDINTINTYSSKYEFNKNYWYIDAMFGYNLNRPIKGVYKKIIDKVISIDIPSGIDCNTGRAYFDSVKSNFTLSLGYFKLGYFFNDGLNNINNIKKIDIGFPEYKK